MVMRIESKLCHLSENKAVVQVYGWLNEKNVGSALAEGATVECAEDKAISRLYKRLNIKKDNESKINIVPDTYLNKKAKEELPKSEKNENINIYQDPSDWSSELTAIDSEIERLKWSRDEENKFLEDKLGYNNRTKITKYSELINYLGILKETESIKSSTLNKVNINTMIEESDIILRDLSWDNKQGREFLLKEFNVSTRKELDEKQLISFVSKLKSMRNQHLSM